jgi:hypothetical protein
MRNDAVFCIYLLPVLGVDNNLYVQEDIGAFGGAQTQSDVYLNRFVA